MERRATECGSFSFRLDTMRANMRIVLPFESSVRMSYRKIRIRLMD